MSYWPVYKSMNLRKYLSPNQTKTLSDGFHRIMDKYVEPFEASAPKMITKHPGPRAIEASAQLSSLIG